MQTSNRILDDLARVASGAASAIAGLRGEIETVVRHQMERLLADLDMVPRDEFEAVKAMAAKARAGQEKLARQVAKLEALVKKVPKTQSARPKAAKTKARKTKARKTKAAKKTARKK